MRERPRLRHSRRSIEGLLLNRLEKRSDTTIVWEFDGVIVVGNYNDAGVIGCCCGRGRPRSDLETTPVSYLSTSACWVGDSVSRMSPELERRNSAGPPPLILPFKPLGG